MLLWPHLFPTSLLLLLLIAFGSCQHKRPAPRPPQPAAQPNSPRSGPVCVRFAPPTQMGMVRSPKLKEMSGLAASWLHPGVLWTHNDHGKSKARIHAIDARGRHLNTWKLKGVDPKDIEDIALGPCAAAGARAKRPCIYLGDLGDNPHVRTQLQIYRVTEPTTLPLPATGSEQPIKKHFRKREIEVLRFHYPPPPDGMERPAARRPDAESLAVLPDARLIVLTKRHDGTSQIFRVPPDPGGDVQAEAMGRLDLRPSRGQPLGAKPATGADLSDDGRWLLVRTNAEIFLFDVGELLSGDAARSRASLTDVRRWRLPHGTDAQGEAVCWDRHEGLWHVSESPHRPVKTPLWRIRCATKPSPRAAKPVAPEQNRAPKSRP